MGHGFLRISQFNLIIFDECHHAQGNHPMTKMMRLFKDYDEDVQPRVIGLTGSIPSTKPENILEDLHRLEETFCATITTARGESFADVLSHSTCPKETLLTYAIGNSANDIHATVVRKVEQMKELIQCWDEMDGTKFIDICDDFSNHFNTLGMYQTPLNCGLQILICSIFIHVRNAFKGLYGGYLANLAAVVDLERVKSQANTSTEKLMSRALITCKSQFSPISD